MIALIDMQTVNVIEIADVTDLKSVQKLVAFPDDEDGNVEANGSLYFAARSELVQAVPEKNIA
jgi:hypothetical protein